MTAGLSWMEVTAVASATVFAAVLAWIVVRPYRPLAGRLRPYVAVARTRLARSVDVAGQAGTGPVFGQGTFRGCSGRSSRSPRHVLPADFVRLGGAVGDQAAAGRSLPRAHRAGPGA